MRYVVIDGNNAVFHGGKDENRRGRLHNLEILIQFLKNRKYNIITLVSSNLKYRIDDIQRLNQLLNKGLITEIPAGVVADLYILETAQILNAQIVSNDLFRQYKNSFPKVRERRVPFLIIEGNVIIPSQYIEIKQEMSEGNPTQISSLDNREKVVG